MFGTMKKAMVAGAVLAAGALGAPSMASAVTATPALPAGADPACVTLTSGGACVAASRTFSGDATLVSASGLQVTCTVSVTVDFAANGTAEVKNILFTPAPPTDCSTNVPGCTVAATAGPAPNDTWGARLFTYTGPTPPALGTYLAVNVSFSNNFTSGCPVTGSFVETGELWFQVDSPVTSAAVAAPNNVVSNPLLGSATVQAELFATDAEDPVFVKDI